MNTGERPDWGVIFDLDGTMVNNNAYHRSAWFTLCEKYCIEMNDHLYHQKIHARTNDRIVPNLFGPEANEALIRQIENEKESMYRDSFRPVMRETAGLLPLLESLRSAGVPCGCSTNSPRENVDFILDGLCLRPYLKAVFYRDQVKVGKPDPEILLLTAEAMEVRAGRCVVFEDSASGFRAARAAGMPYIAITAGADPNELKEAGDAAGVMPDFTAMTIEMLRDVVSR